MNNAAPTTRIPKHVREMPLGLRMRWARRRAGLSHDRLVEKLGRSNRSHLIKIERGDHVPRRDLRDAWADATSVPRELFDTEEDDEVSSLATGRDRDLFDALVKRAVAAQLSSILEMAEARP